MIEVRSVRSKYKDDTEDLLLIDGVFIYDDRPSVRLNKKSSIFLNQIFDVIVYGKHNRAAITTHRFSDIQRNIWELAFRERYRLIEDEQIYQSIRIIRSGPWQFWITLRLGFDSMSWKRLWSAEEYTDEFKLAAERHDTFSSYLVRPEDVDDDFTSRNPRALVLWIPVRDNDSVIETEIRSHARMLQHIHKQAQEYLISKIRGESVARIFDFPEEARIACEQYLLYFVQFLKDIGIEATAELQRAAGGMLFTVTPKDKGEALGHIRRALDVYLNLPTNPNLGSSLGVTADIQTQRLVANIQHLHGQLMLANAAMQLKDAAIQQHQATIEQQRRLLTGDVLVESVQRAGGDDGDKEKILGGTVAITKFKWKWFEFDVPDIYRRIREYVFEKEGGESPP